MTGATSLTQSGDDVVQRIDLAVKVSIPLVGGKVEDLIAGFVGKAFDAENKVGVKWLARRVALLSRASLGTSPHGSLTRLGTLRRWRAMGPGGPDGHSDADASGRPRRRRPRELLRGADAARRRGRTAGAPGRREMPGSGRRRLVDDLLVARAVDLGFATAVGHCLDLEAGISFAPVVEAVRGPCSSDVADDEQPAPRAPHAHAARARRTPEPEPVRLLDDLRLAILEAARDTVRPCSCWRTCTGRTARPRTWSVAGTARLAVACSLVLTVRSDALHRRHPLRVSLAELGRSSQPERLDLAPLDRRGRRCARPAQRFGAGRHRESSRRSSPAPRETRCTPRSSSPPNLGLPCPDHLADLLLARVDRLSDDVSAVSCASPLPTAPASTPRSWLQVTGSRRRGRSRDRLREALDATTSCAQRDRRASSSATGLIREAVYDDLLPDERTRTHAVLRRGAPGRVRIEAAKAPLLARAEPRWPSTGARRRPPARTLAASVRAGLRRDTTSGQPRRVSTSTYAVSLWDRVPDAERLAGHARAEILLMLARAHHGRATSAGSCFEALTREAVSELIGPDTDPPGGQPRLRDARPLPG